MAGCLLEGSYEWFCPKDLVSQQLPHPQIRFECQSTQMLRGVFSDIDMFEGMLRSHIFNAVLAPASLQFALVHKHALNSGSGSYVDTDVNLLAYSGFVEQLSQPSCNCPKAC